jgi:hypothetical protein
VNEQAFRAGRAAAARSGGAVVVGR